jgi:hypothetical protein
VTPRETLDAARSRGIRLGARGDALRVVAPAGTLDAELQAALVRSKPAILQLLAGPTLDEAGRPTEHCRACGCPNWWTSATHSGWHCSACEPRPESFNLDYTGRVVVVDAGAWAKH